MNFKMYHTQDDDNVINKDITLVHTIAIQLKNDTDIIKPSIVLQDNGKKQFMNCNYAYIDMFDRYYFITDIETLNASMLKINLDCDVLETYKQDILKSDMKIRRGLKQNEYFNTNPNVKVTKDIDVYKSDVSLKKQRSYVLSTIGGEKNG